MERLSTIVTSIKAHDFELVSLEPHNKDGGVFVHFKYNAVDPGVALETIKKGVQESAAKLGGVPSWTGLRRGDVWLVKGTPWREVPDGPHSQF